MQNPPGLRRQRNRKLEHHNCFLLLKVFDMAQISNTAQTWVVCPNPQRRTENPLRWEQSAHSRELWTRKHTIPLAPPPPPAPTRNTPDLGSVIILLLSCLGNLSRRSSLQVSTSTMWNRDKCSFWAQLWWAKVITRVGHLPRAQCHGPLEMEICSLTTGPS